MINNIKKLFVLGIVLFVNDISLFAQILEPSTWTHDASKTELVIGEEIDLTFTATIDSNWYLYSSDFDPDCGPTVTTFTFEAHDSYELVGGLTAIEPIEKYEEVFECNVRIFKNKGTFLQRVKVLTTNPVITGSYQFQVCSDIDGLCIPFDYEFEFKNFVVSAATEPTINDQKQKPTTKPVADNPVVVTSEVPSEPDTQSSQEVIPVTKTKVTEYSPKNTGPILDESLNVDSEKNNSLLLFMIIAFIAGLTSLLTPCVFPMIPMTVTFFLKGNNGGGKAISQGLIFGLSIILIYTLLGTLFAFLLGPEGLNALATNWLLNLFIFAVFIIFALSFLGLFEINLPSSLANKLDQKADKGGLIGVFFMAATLAVVSFSCTVPIAGSILFLSADGQVLKPVVGMLAYSTAFAVPFALFAIFPNWLSGLPKSGGWLNSVKVVLGFIELALAFKFLSIADQAYHWGILDRDINIGIWVVILTLMGFYLLGKIRLPHDSKMETISVGRLILATATFSFVIYLIPGLWGAPLKVLAGYLPPMYTHDFNLLSEPINDPDYAVCDQPLYDDFLHLPHGLKGYFDYDQALACARGQNKPLFIDFTGHGCTNCREMEAVVWSSPEVLKRLKNDYVIVALYVDDKTVLPEDRWYESSYDNKIKKTIGKQNADLQIRNLKNNAQPFYLLVDLNENVMVSPIAYNKDVQDFISFLDLGKKRFKEALN